MKKTTLLLLASFYFFSVGAQTKIYNSSSFEMIFSFAKIQKGGNEINSNLRFSPVFNFQSLVNYDISQGFGIFHGMSIRNVGFIYDIPGTDSMMKYRTYNIGIPLGIKIGNIKNGFFIYGGYEFEMPFHYKEKLFINDDKKDITSIWFSNRTNWYTQSVFIGFNTKSGFNIKLKYYLDGFFNQDYVGTYNGARIKPFQDMNAHVIYFSLNWNLFKDVKNYGKEFRKPKSKTEAKSYSYIISHDR
ncbi:MAG: hypothetical protein WCO28_12595 [Bacteroidota bacterium]